MRGFTNTRLLLAAALCCYAGFTQAQIQSTSSTNGVSIDVASTNVTNITAPDNAIIEYSQFDVGSGQTVHFLQPSVASRVLALTVTHPHRSTAISMPMAWCTLSIRPVSPDQLDC